MRQTMDGAAFRAMLLSAAASIENHKQEVNELNVFPVPDGDTGTNMSLTIGAAANELRQKANDATPLGVVAEMTSGALLRGARGNSGVILSLLFRGFSRYLKETVTADGFEFASALAVGVESAYRAVMKPAEGTILTVSRVSAAAGVAVGESEPALETVLEAIIAAARIALDETVEQNPTLKKAGVVDAGGMGFLLILEGMLASLQGHDVQYEAAPKTEQPKQQADFAEFETGDIKFCYCTEFIVQRENNKDPEKLRAFLSGMGDCLVLVDDDEIIKVHVHTNHPGVVLEEALSYGSFVTTKIENMRLQHTEKVLSETEAAAAAKPAVAAPEKTYGVVAVCAGDGLASVFTDLGVDAIIKGGQTMNPSTEDILEAVNRTPAETVFVLPNNKNIIMAAQQTVGLTEKKVVVIETKTVPQGISAMLAFNSEMGTDEIREAMLSAAGGVHTMQVTYAARNSDFDGKAINAGEYIGLLDGALVGNGSDLPALLTQMASRVCDSEFLTVFYGEDVTEDQANSVAELLRAACPNAEVTVLSGGQPVYSYLISAE